MTNHSPDKSLTCRGTRPFAFRYAVLSGALAAAMLPMRTEQRLWSQPPAAISTDRDVGQRGISVPALEGTQPTEVQPRLSLADLEQMALTSNPTIAKSSALVGAARGNWVQAGLAPNPSVGYDGQQLGSGGRAEQHGIMFNQEIVRGGKLKLSRVVADREYIRAQQELAVQQQKVVTDVRIAFYQVLLAQKQIDLTSNLVRITRLGAKAADSLFKGQEASRSDVLQAQLEVENAQVLATNARNRADAAWRNLRAVVGDPHLPFQELDGDAYAPPLEFDFQDVITRLQTSSPEIAVAMAEISRARSTVDRARVEPIPNVNFQGLINVRDNGIGGRSDAGISLSMPIPVFNRNQGAIVKAQHEVMAAERNLEQVERSLERRLAPAFERYANARNQVERYRDAILPVAEESLELTRKMYELGEAGYLALLTAQRTFSQTNLNYLEALRELRTVEAEIEGQLLSDSLGSGNSR